MTEIVAVTGAEGFIGSHLVERLVRHGQRVRAMVLVQLLRLPGLAGHAAGRRPRRGRGRCPATCATRRRRTTWSRGARVVYHLAALIAIPYSYRAPRSYVDTNVIGTLNVLEAVRAQDTTRLVHTSTSETYGTARTVAIDETHPLQAQSPYAASKVAADKLVESYHLSFGVQAVTLCPFNTFGPRQSARAVIPTVITPDRRRGAHDHAGCARPDARLPVRRGHRRRLPHARRRPRVRGGGRAVQRGHRRRGLGRHLAADIARLMDADIEIVEDVERLRPEGLRGHAAGAATPRGCASAPAGPRRTPATPAAEDRSPGSATRRTSPATARATTPADPRSAPHHHRTKGQRHARRDPRRRQGCSPAPLHHPAAQALVPIGDQLLDPRDRAPPARPAGLRPRTLAIGYLGNLIRAYVGDGPLGHRGRLRDRGQPRSAPSARSCRSWTGCPTSSSS